MDNDIPYILPGPSTVKLAIIQEKTNNHNIREEPQPNYTFNEYDNRHRDNNCKIVMYTILATCLHSLVVVGSLLTPVTNLYVQQTPRLVTTTKFFCLYFLALCQKETILDN